MGSSPPPTKKLDSLLPKPPKENLVSHFILGEIIDHIGHIHEDFPDVDVPRLKWHLWEIRNKNVTPELHLRGFLKVFEKTKVFKDAFEELDHGMQVQLRTFMAGGGEEVVFAAGGKGNTFYLPPSPAVKHHFREITQEFEEKVEKIEAKVEKLFHHEAHPNGTNGTNGIATRQVDKLQEDVEKLHEMVRKLHEMVGKLSHHENHSHAVNGSEANRDVDEFAVKESTNGYVEKAKEDSKKISHHEKHSSADSGISVHSPVVNGHAMDEFAVKEATNEHAVNRVTNGHVEELVSSTAGYPRIFEDQAKTKTMEVSYRSFILSNRYQIMMEKNNPTSRVLDKLLSVAELADGFSGHFSYILFRTRSYPKLTLSRYIAIKNSKTGAKLCATLHYGHLSPRLYSDYKI
jgi:hypothetical protein